MAMPAESSRLLEGRTLLVTGAGNGIGRAVAHQAAVHGARAVIAVDLSSEPRSGASVESLVRQAGAEFFFHAADVSDAQSLETAVRLADAYGGLDVMVCNAGMVLANDTLEVAESDLDRLINVNLKGVFLSARAAARPMIARGRGGSIVIVSSIGGLRGSAATLSYCATKGAARLYAQSLAAALGPQGIRVNAVCPGVIDTGFTPPDASPTLLAELRRITERAPLRRNGRADEVAGAIVWLGSDLSSFVTGASILVDGGLTSVI